MLVPVPNIEVPSDSVFAASQSPSKRKALWRGVTMPLRVPASLVRVPVRRIWKDPKRPSWNVQFETVISTLRSVAKNVPRNVWFLQKLTGLSIPQMLLPEGAKYISGVLRHNEQRIPVEWVWPSSPAAGLSFSNRTTSANCGRRVIFYLHGGAFCLCGPGTHRNLVSHIALACNAIVCVVDYRRPPEVSHSEALGDCIAAYRAVLDLGVPSSMVAVAGDSAGGSLVASMLCKIRDTKEAPLPSSAIVISPWVDLSDGDTRLSPSMLINSNYDYLPHDLLRLFALETVGSGDAKDPQISPLFADLSCLPPFLVIAGDNEVLRDQIAAFGAALEAKNANSKLHLYPDMVHVFPLFQFCHETPRQAICDIARHVSQYCVPLRGIDASLPEQREIELTTCRLPGARGRL